MKRLINYEGSQVYNSLMKRSKLLPVACCLLPVFLSGCAFNLLRRAMHPEDLTPAQIEAYNKVGLDIYMCFQVSGPPPVGSTAFFLWPKNKPLQQSFGANCQILQAVHGQAQGVLF